MGGPKVSGLRASDAHIFLVQEHNTLKWLPPYARSVKHILQ